MNRKTAIIIVVLIILAVIALGIVAERAKGDSDGKLSREEQIRVMSECYSDAKKVKGVNWSMEMAVAFFYHRTGMDTYYR